MDLLTYSLGRRFRRVGDNVLLMRDIEAYLPWGSAKDRYRIDWLTITYKTRHFLVAILPREFHGDSCQNLYGDKIKLSQSPCLPTGQTNVKADGMNFYGKAFEYALAT